jgi:hypothetical protein
MKTPAGLTFVLLLTMSATLASACGAGPEPFPAEPGPSVEVERRVSPSTRAGGDAAVWVLQADSSLQKSSTRFTALVDGRCLPGEEAAATSFCVPDSTRFKP